jgi:hypothetical protein
VKIVEKLVRRKEDFLTVESHYKRLFGIVKNEYLQKKIAKSQTISTLKQR